MATGFMPSMRQGRFLWMPRESGSGHVATLGELTQNGRWLRRSCEELDARLVVVDSLAAAYGSDENQRGLVRAFLGSWDAWARDTRCAVLIIAIHPSPGAPSPDPTDWEAGVRAHSTFGLEAAELNKVEKGGVESAISPPSPLPRTPENQLWPRSTSFLDCGAVEAAFGIRPLRSARLRLTRRSSPDTNQGPHLFVTGGMEMPSPDSECLGFVAEHCGHALRLVAEDGGISDSLVPSVSDLIDAFVNFDSGVRMDADARLKDVLGTEACWAVVEPTKLKQFKPDTADAEMIGTTASTARPASNPLLLVAVADSKTTTGSRHEAMDAVSLVDHFGSVRLEKG